MAIAVHELGKNRPDLSPRPNLRLVPPLEESVKPQVLSPEPPKTIVEFTVGGYQEYMGDDPDKLLGLNLLFAQGAEVAGIEVVRQEGRMEEHSAYVVGDQTAPIAPDHTGRLRMPRTGLRGPVSVQNGKRGVETRVHIGRR